MPVPNVHFISSEPNKKLEILIIIIKLNSQFIGSVCNVNGQHFMLSRSKLFSLCPVKLAFSYKMRKTREQIVFWRLQYKSYYIKE